MEEKQFNQYQKYTKFEKARIVGARATQIESGAPAILKFKKKELEDMEFRPIEIAKQELEKDLELIKKKISDNQSKKQELKKIIADERNKLLELEKQLSILKERKSEVEKNITKISQLNEKLKDYLDIENKLNKINDLIEENKSTINKKIGEINSIKQFNMKQIN